mgnify:CR=1 FL=1
MPINSKPFMYINKGTNEHVVSICKSLGLFAPVKCESFGPIYALKDEGEKI